MWKGKLKAVTFSYEDGVTQDIRFIEMLDRYGLIGTFNINSELLGLEGHLIRQEKRVNHTKIPPEKVKEVYKNHEVAAHTLTHPTLITVEDDNEVIRQVEQDRLNLEKLTGYEILGMAYPGGGVTYDERIIRLIKENTGIKYSRSINSSGNFELPTNYLDLSPSVYHMDFDKMFALGEEFLNLKPETPKMFYIWGHTYEFDIHNTWNKMEEFLKMISGKEDIFYGTNREVLLPQNLSPKQI